MRVAVNYPSLKARKFLAILQREPLAYEIVRQDGSHRKLESRNGFPPLGFAFHDRATVPPGLIRRYLEREIGLSRDEARDVLGG